MSNTMAVCLAVCWIGSNIFMFYTLGIKGAFISNTIWFLGLVLGIYFN